jgi:hypothetical protein
MPPTNDKWRFPVARKTFSQLALRLVGNGQRIQNGHFVRFSRVFP